MTTTMFLPIIVLVWTLLAFGFGIMIGRGIRNADRIEQPTADDFPDDPRELL